MSIRLYDRVLLRRDLVSDEGAKLSRGSLGVVEDVTGDRAVVTVAIPRDRVAGLHVFETCSAPMSDLTPLRDGTASWRLGPRIEVADEYL